MSQVVKIAVSLSSEDFSTIEQTRKKEGLTRSAVIARAINTLRQKEERESLISRYEEGYRRQPEGVAEIRAKETATLEVLSKENW